MARVQAEFYQPIEPATGNHNGVPFVVNPSEIFSDEHELVRAYPHLFKPVEATRQRPAVEDATSEPGEPGERRGE